MEIKNVWCSTCKKYLPSSEFRKNSLRKSGFGSSCKECERKRENSVSGRYKSYRRNARQRGIRFDITKDEFIVLISGKCHYCGTHGSPYVGIDRVNNEEGYLIQNCVPCCEWCNKIKMAHTESDMIEHIKKIYYHLVINKGAEHDKCRTRSDH